MSIHTSAAPPNNNAAAQDYARLFEKFYGGNSRIDRLVEKSRLQQDPAAGGRIDAEIEHRVGGALYVCAYVCVCAGSWRRAGCSMTLPRAGALTRRLSTG